MSNFANASVRFLLLMGCAAALHPRPRPQEPAVRRMARSPFRTAAPGGAVQLRNVEALFAAYRGKGTPGAAFVVVKDGKVALQGASGMANLEYGIPISARTPFHIGSVSKQFTAYAVLLLQQEGRLSLDSDVRIHIPELPDFGTPITLRHLLHFQSGLREREHLGWLAGITSADTQDTSQVLRLLSRQRGLNFQPGEEVEYCNTGYDLLGEVVARVTGSSLRAWTVEHVFRPLGMRHTWFADDARELIPMAACPYVPGEGTGFLKGLLSHDLVGETGVVTTLEDMALWLLHLDRPAPANRAIVQRMLREVGTLNDGRSGGYGFGLGITEHRGRKVAVQSGSDAGFRACVMVFPEEHVGIAILGNLHSISPMATAYRIADLVLGLGPEPAQAPAPAAAPPPVASLDAAALRGYEGKYFSEELETQYTLKEMDGRLVVGHWRNEDVVLTPRTLDIFTGSRWWLSQLTFSRDSAGTVTGFVLSKGRVRNLVFTRR